MDASPVVTKRRCVYQYVHGRVSVYTSVFWRTCGCELCCLSFIVQISVCTFAFVVYMLFPGVWVVCAYCIAYAKY